MSELILVTLQPRRLQVKPGEELNASIEVQNHGRVVDSYSVEVLGLNAEWYQLPDANVSLFPGDSEAVRLTFRPPAGSAAVANSYDFTIRVSSSVAPAEVTNLNGSLEVEPSYGHHLNIRPEKITGVVGSYIFGIANTGNAELVFDLEGSDPEGFCRFTFQPFPPAVAPGEYAEVAVTVKPSRRPFLEPPRTYDLTIVAAPRQTTERPTFHAQLDALPWARKWYFPAALVMLAVLAVIIYTGLWVAVERDNFTYLRGEQWDDVTISEQLRHGLIYSFDFDLKPRAAADKSLLPINLRGDVTWPASDEAPPTMAIILRDPFGNCWRPKLVDRSEVPFQFRMKESSRCDSINYRQLLVNKTNPDVLTPAEYISGDPLVWYCVRDVAGDPRVKFLSGTQLQTPSNDTDSKANWLGEDDQHWTIYIVNPHPSTEWPEVKIKLKATSENGGQKKDKYYTLSALEATPPKSVSPSLQCFWDNETDIPEGGRMEHGVVYTKTLEVTQRPAGTGSEFSGAPDTTHPKCFQEEDESTISSAPGNWLCGDVTWEVEESDSGKITANNVFIILRISEGEGGKAKCWSRFEAQTSTDSEGTPFEFNLKRGRPCQQELTTPEQNLWNLMNWTTFIPSRYQGVQPLVKFCAHENGQTLFGRSSAIPRMYEESWDQNNTLGMTLYIMNPSSFVEPPRVTVKLKGDKNWKIELKDLPNPALGDTPLVSPGSCPAIGER